MPCCPCTVVNNSQSMFRRMMSHQELVLYLNKVLLQHHLLCRDRASATQNMRTQVGIQNVFTLKVLILRCLMEMLCHRHRSLKLDVIWLMILHLNT